MISFNRKKDTIEKSLALKSSERKVYSLLNLKSIIQIDFPFNQYYRAKYKKNQIVLHHTVSGKGVEGDISWWKQTKSRIATSLIFDRSGRIYQCFSTRYWAHHLGIKARNNGKLNKESIGIELDSWGGLKKVNSNWYPAYYGDRLEKLVISNKIRPVTNVVEYPRGFRGYYAFEKYSDKQIESVRKMLIFLGERYGISLEYHDDMWGYSNKALSGVNGVWSHVSFRKDKSDCHPQKELVDMLKSLTR
jgi:N-acetyl-anhydromuramyl-L-alanine amidase AmpD